MHTDLRFLQISSTMRHTCLTKQARQWPKARLLSNVLLDFDLMCHNSTTYSRADGAADAENCLDSITSSHHLVCLSSLLSSRLAESPRRPHRRPITLLLTFRSSLLIARTSECRLVVNLQSFTRCVAPTPRFNASPAS